MSVIAPHPEQTTSLLSFDDGVGEVVVPLQQPVLIIGRSPTADLRLDDETVSRQHALLLVRQGAAMLIDNHSRNGVWMDGRRVRAVLLRDGDQFVVGPHTLRYFGAGPDGESIR